jgi:endonuclease G
VADAGFGSGYDDGFLGTPVPPPGPGAWAADLVEVDGRSRLDYTHFSLVLSRSRRLARWVAWNIDGTTLLGDDDDSIGREGLDFRPDPRVPATVQTLDDVYRDNPLDRGHLARRRDLLWGPRADAVRANADSFYFTNITPQMDTFNQSVWHGLWGLLENAVLAEVRLDDERVSVLGGPVLGEDDRAFRGTQVPREFWKVLAYRLGGDLRARSFLLTQDLTRLESVSPLDEFRTYEVTPDELSRRTGLDFPDVLQPPPAARSAAPRVLEGLGDVSW